jgi:hypothetical protein
MTCLQVYASLVHRCTSQRPLMPQTQQSHRCRPCREHWPSVITCFQAVASDDQATSLSSFLFFSTCLFRATPHPCHQNSGCFTSLNNFVWFVFLQPPFSTELDGAYIIHYTYGCDYNMKVSAASDGHAVACCNSSDYNSMYNFAFDVHVHFGGECSLPCLL